MSSYLSPATQLTIVRATSRVGPSPCVTMIHSETQIWKPGHRPSFPQICCFWNASGPASAGKWRWVRTHAHTVTPRWPPRSTPSYNLHAPTYLHIISHARWLPTNEGSPLRRVAINTPKFRLCRAAPQAIVGCSVRFLYALVLQVGRT